jgi:methionyl-tRNA formyltransferase
VKILFFGTAAVSVPFLAELLKHEQIAGVVAQPDRPAARGYKIHVPEVKALALEKNVPVFQPERFTDDVIASLRGAQADLGIAVSYGRIIPESLFSSFKYGCFNVHFSLLPRYRGAAPVQRALMNGETETGVTTFWIEKGLDTGPVLIQRSLPILPEDDAVSLMQKLVALGIEVMNETVARIRAGDRAARPQAGTPSTAPCLTREDGVIDWTKSAVQVNDLIRGTRQWPGASTAIKDGRFAGTRLKIYAAQVVPERPEGAGAGQITGVVKNAGFTVACGRWSLLVEQVHPENKKPMGAWAFWQSGYLRVGDHLG